MFNKSDFQTTPLGANVIPVIIRERDATVASLRGLGVLEDIQWLDLSSGAFEENVKTLVTFLKRREVE